MLYRFVFNKLILLTVFAVGLGGCIEPPQPTKTVTRAIATGANGCPENIDLVDIERNDKISWKLDASSSGYPGIEAFGVAFDGYNPTYCVNAASVPKNQDITCTIKVDSRLESICYTVSTRSNGGAQTCEKQFVMRVGNNLPHNCTNE